ncbi:MAG: excisionase family DNA-binding protein [Polyangiaceae bacterium]|nr:excisionase family DNA-binding protein [Polyangiaceae bacterium]
MATNSIPLASTRFFTPGQVAAWAGVTSMTIIRWCDAGVLHATMTPGGHRRITEDSVRDYLTKRGLAIPAELTPPELQGTPRVVVLATAKTRRALGPKLKGLTVKTYAEPLEALVEACCTPPALVLLEANGENDPAAIVRALRSNGRTSGINVTVWGDATAADAARQAGATHAFRTDGLADVERVLTSLRARAGS